MGPPVEGDHLSTGRAHSRYSHWWRADLLDLLFLRDGEEVKGAYMKSNLRGSIKGKITDGVLHFRWSEENSRRCKSRSQGDAFRGTWGVGEAEQGAGEFMGKRQKKENTGR